MNKEKEQRKEQILAWRKKVNSVTLALTIVFTALIGILVNYNALPAFTIHSSGAWLFVLVLLTVAVVLAIIFNAINGVVFKPKMADSWSYDWDREYENLPATKKYTIAFIFSIVLGIYLLIFFVTSIPAWKMVSAKQYASLIEVNDAKFEDDFAEFNPDDIIVVDVKTAQRLGDRTLGGVTNASWFEADDEYNLIKIGEDYYRISSVKYGGFFKWLKAKDEGIPGFILVNAKTQESSFYKLDEGIKYSPSACFSYNLKRHLHKLYPSYILGKSFFEVDDEFVPYWITNVQKAQIGMRGGYVPTSVLITNAITGETKEYSFEDLPEWVDHANSVSGMMELIEYHYKYQNGFFNTWSSNTNVFYTSYHYRDSNNKDEENEYTPFDGYNSLVTKKGEIWFYIGLTPANAAETNVAILLISPRTGEVFRYECNGAEESSAQIAAEGLVQNMRYSASFPTVVNIGGIETYFMVLKDSAGLVQRYALCNVAQYSKVVQSETLDGALTSYRQIMGLESAKIEEENSNATLEETESKDISGMVTQVSRAEVGGYTYYYFLIEGSDTVFMSTIENSSFQPVKLMEGATVSIKYYASTSEAGLGIVTKISFEE